jgi:signal transduction histidine kinase
LALSVKRWSQRRLLYPIAIFAIIAPTVVMGLFGAYALREIELRPSLYREELRNVQDGLGLELEQRISELRLEPPAGEGDLPRVSDEVRKYFANYNRVFASRCFYGINGRVMGSHSVDGQSNLPVPVVLQDALTTLAQTQRPGLTRESLSVNWTGDQRREPTPYVVYQGDGGFLAWELIPSEIDRLINGYLARVDLDNDSLVLQPTDRHSLDWRSRPNDRYETLGFVPVHAELLPSRYVVLKLDADRQFYKDSKLLSSIFVIIAVLCVPIVASATLMVVHMILRESSEARKKVDFVSNVTHELKTPLTSIRMFVETLKLGRVKNPEQINACLDTIMTETDRLGALIDHVLSFSKVENQVKKYNFQLANLPQVVRDTISLFRAQMSGQDGEIRLKILPGVPSEATFDKDAIREVVLNLLSNAIKYSGDDKFVTVLVGVDRNDLFVEVADRGVGIPAEDQSRIFEKFYRVDQALSRKVDGTGLGLAICKEIVQAHDGRITVESMWGKGSRFTVYIPYKRAKAPTRRHTAVTTRLNAVSDRVHTGEHRIAPAETKVPAGDAT